MGSSGFKAQGLCAPNLASRVWSLEFAYKIQNLGFGVSGLGFRVSGFGFWVWDFGFRDWGLEFRAEELRELTLISLLPLCAHLFASLPFGSWM